MEELEEQELAGPKREGGKARGAGGNELGRMKANRGHRLKSRKSGDEGSGAVPRLNAPKRMIIQVVTKPTTNYRISVIGSAVDSVDSLTCPRFLYFFVNPTFSSPTMETATNINDRSHSPEI